jgi:hypothetical protein
MKRTNKQTKVRFPVFGYEVRVIFSRDLIATGRRLGADLTGDAAAWVTNDEHPNVGYLVFAAAPSPGTISHEASHAVREMLESRGATLDNETFAYHIDFLVERIHKALKRG